MKTTLPLLLGLLLLPSLGFSQADASADKTIEEKRLQSSGAVMMLSSLVAEPNREDKLKALDLVDSMITNKKVSDKDTDVVALVEELGTEGTSKLVYQNRRLINDFPDIRRRSAELLGRIGGDDAREALISMAQKDKEPMVMAEAAYSLGLIAGGDDAERNRVQLVIAHLVIVQDSVNPDNGFAFAATAALENLTKAANGKVNPEVFEALVRIQNGNYVPPVRDKARKVLESYVNAQ